LLQSVHNVSVISSASLGVLVADTHGSVHILDKEFEPTTSWVAHVGGRVTHMAERQGILVTLGVCALPVICLSTCNEFVDRKKIQ